MVFFLLVSCHSIDDADGEKETVGYFKADFPDVGLADTKSIKGRHVFVRDAVMAYLVFRVNPAEAEAILSKGFQAGSREEFTDISEGANRPKWWPASVENMECFKCDPWRKDMSYSVAVIGYERDQNLMYFCHSAFD
jgi:hypothetical protein